ncbi:MAG: sulfotransferase [Actinomycetota bacterium]|nr:sulfotransferase [Actinomycetota bacterium]
MTVASDVRGAAGETGSAPRPRKSAAPVFVVGAPFSGATTLGWALAQHPRCEPVIGGEAGQTLLTSLRVLEEELLPLLGTDVVDPIQSALGVGRASEAAGTALVAALAAELTGSGLRRSRHWVVGGSEWISRLAIARRLFPDVRLIHVHRDLDAVVDHLVDSARREQPALSRREAAAIWERATRSALEAERLVDRERVLRLPYQRLVGDPEGAVRDCLELLEARWHPACLWPLRLLATGPPRAGRGSVDVPALARAAPRRSRETVRGHPFHRRLRRLVETVVGRGASVLVASRGDEELIRFRGRTGLHFPQLPGGTWAGHYPADGRAAVAHLEELRRTGASHLVFPRPALWWLQHYSELRRHLEQSARLIACDNELCVIWELGPAPALSLPASLRSRPRTPKEPDNYAAFRIERPTPPPRRRRSLPGSLWAVTTFYNPGSYASKATNYRRFRQGLAETGVPLLCVELAFADAPFELGREDAEHLIQLRGADVLWQKERLLNIGVATLPEDCDKVAWLDADVVFARKDWPHETARLLETHVAVQPFSHCVRLPHGAGDCEPALLPFGSGEGELFYGIGWGVRAKGRGSLAHYARHGHTGFAWAARRDLLARHGLYDANLLGNGDTDIAHAMFGNLEYWSLRKLGDRARVHLRRWAEPFSADVGASVGHVDGVLTHLWHGSAAHRLYDRPLDVLQRFDPERDLEFAGNGLYAWGDAAPPELRAWSRGYFPARREDG